MRKLLAVLIPLALALPALAADWPQWLGPNRNGSSPEKGLLTTWPADGPKVLWKVKGGDGYSSIAIAKGRAYTMVQRDGAEYAIALDPASGKELWATKLDGAYKNQYGNGPRSTPSIDGGLAYVHSANGLFACLKTEDGSIVWQHDLFKEFGAKNLSWGVAASPLIEGELVLAIPGGSGGSVAAFNKKDGKLVWKAGDDKAGYASPVAVTVGDQRQLIFFTATSLSAVTAKDGKELWRMPWKTEFDCNIATPLVIGDQIFVSSGEKVGCAMFRLSAGGPPEVVWESKGAKSVMTNYWANTVHHDGYLYGLSGEFSGKIHLNCVDAKNGKLVWSQKEFGKGAITLADGHLFITTKKGDLVLVKASPEKYEEKGRCTPLGETRTVPTLSDGRLFLRDLQNILCMDVKK